MENFDLFARFFDLDHGDIRDDVQFYQGFAQRTGSPLLDAGCGTGRVLVPLARAGFTVAGLDISSAMLARAQVRLDAEPELLLRAGLWRGDLRTFELDQRFALAFLALNSFLHLVTLEDQRAALARLHGHLLPSGMLLLDLFNPLVGMLAASEGQLLHEWTRQDPETGHIVLKFVTHHSDFAAQVVHATFLYDEVDERGALNRTIAAFRMRYVSRTELELLLGEAGFVVEALYGNYDLSPYTHESPKLLVVARRS